LESTQTTRPQWAKQLPTKLWRHLQSCQSTPRPTLAALRKDVAWQAESGVNCWDCKSALSRVESTTLVLAIRREQKHDQRRQPKLTRRQFQALSSEVGR